MEGQRNRGKRKVREGLGRGLNKNIHPKDVQSYHKDTCSTMFIAASFIIARMWK